MNIKADNKKTGRRFFNIVLYSLIFGTLTGTFFAVMAGFFVPVVFTDWAGSFVCEGKMVFQNLQRAYYCYTSQTSFYELGNKVFWTMFRFFLLPCIGASSALLFAFFGAIDFMLRADED